MDRLLKYTSNVSALQFYQICRFAGVITLSIIYVKSALSTKEVSYIEFFLFSANLFSFFWSFGFKNAFLSYFPSLPREDQRKFTFTLFVLYVLFGLIAAALLYTSIHQGILFNWDLTEQGFAPLLVIYLLCNTPTILVEHIFILHDDQRRLIQYAIFVFISPILFTLVALLISVSVTAVFYGFLLFAGLKLLYLAYVLTIYSEFRIDRRYMLPYIAFAMPLICHALIGNGVEYVDGYLIRHYFDKESFAVFRYGARELPFVVLLVGALTTVLVPRAVNNASKTLVEIKQQTTKLMHFLFPLSIILVLFSPLIFPLVYSSEFKESAYLFNIYALIIISRILLPQVILFGHHLNHLLLSTTASEFVLNVGLSLLLMQVWGMKGIAVASVIAFSLAKVAMIIYNRWRFGIRLSEYTSIPLYLGYSFLLIVSFVVSMSIS